MDNHTNPESAGQEFAAIGAIGGGLLGLNGPLVGAFFVDILNALIIKFFIGHMTF